MEKTLNQNPILGNGKVEPLPFCPVLVTDQLPIDHDKKYMWLDSSGVIKEQELSSYKEVEELIGWYYDTWIDITPPEPNRMKALENCDPIKVSENVFDIAPELHEINLK